MQTRENDRRFGEDIATLYQDLLVPMIFTPYAVDLASRLARLPVASVLELAAGTGVVTRELASRLAPDVQLVATDLNEAMLAVARKQGTSRPVRWRQADAMALPFDDASFDAVACQFGAMFFPDRAHAFAEARRVLRPGGTLWFNVWDGIQTNDFAWVIQQAVAGLFPDDPPRFLERLPHGYVPASAIARDLAQAGFAGEPLIETVAARSQAITSAMAAIAYCQGTPLRNEIVARDPARLGEATEAATAAMTARFGAGPVTGRIQALVVRIDR
ncbi:class I SAM-dependent methyltransferase [Frateuria sp. MAH-13]|uniref:Class I SAM-dependent methyltransferase n=1 Tax=Frateuria flava TaxID=2821489 RepID=A0ABS4DN76_9GAMM|nr:class I SAM-dependent methyltransferase [Frateuria flava]MBP1474502.1 class I SAM-dependent methyltransferase [Frateuria flava]